MLGAASFVPYSSEGRAPDGSSTDRLTSRSGGRFDLSAVRGFLAQLVLTGHRLLYRIGEPSHPGWFLMSAVRTKRIHEPLLLLARQPPRIARTGAQAHR